jgi:hypothetical protein
VPDLTPAIAVPTPKLPNRHKRAGIPFVPLI